MERVRKEIKKMKDELKAELKKIINERVEREKANIEIKTIIIDLEERVGKLEKRLDI